MYDKARYNKTYYEKNKEKLRELQRQKRQKMKEALQKVEAEEEAAETESQEPEGMSKFFQHIRHYQKYAIQGCRQWLTGCLTGCLQGFKEDHREQAEHYTVLASGFLKSVRLTMIINNIANALNIIIFNDI